MMLKAGEANKKGELSVYYQFLMFRNILEEIVSEYENKITTPSEDRTAAILDEAERKVNITSEKTPSEISYEYQYIVMRDTLAEILKLNKDINVRKVIDDRKLQQIHLSAIKILSKNYPNVNLDFAYGLKL